MEQTGPLLQARAAHIDTEPLNTLSRGAGDENEPTAYLLGPTNMDTMVEASGQVIDLIRERICTTEKPFTGITPQQLAPLFQDLDLDAPLPSLDGALDELERLYLRDAIYFHHPRYVAHLNCPVVYPAVLAEMILSSVNSSLDTWDQSAGGTLIEQRLIDWTAARIGFGTGSDGIFTSGGTQSNLMALLLARDWFTQRYRQHCTKDNGLPPDSDKFRIFASAVGHFSVQKAAAILGLGYDAVVSVPCDDRFRMDMVALAEAIAQTREQGCIPIAVIGTAGTTDFGSIDPLPAIADLCEREKIWFHADAAYGCGLLLTPQHRHQLQGIERADSVTVDYHKSFFQPVSCGAFLVKNKTHLNVVTHHAEYLNPLSQTREGTPNLVNKSIQTTRRFDALKLWLTLRMMGPDALGALFADALALAQNTYIVLADDSEIEVLHQPQLSALVFRFLPVDNNDSDLIDAANAHIRKAIFKTGAATIAGTRVNGRQYLKFTLLNPQTTLDDIQVIVDMIKRFGRAFFAGYNNLLQEAANV